MKISVYAGSFVFTLFSTVLNLVALNRRAWYVHFHPFISQHDITQSLLTWRFPLTSHRLVYKAPPSVGLPLKTVWGLFEVCDYGPDGQKQCRDFPVPGFDCVATKIMKAHGGFSFCDDYRTAGVSVPIPFPIYLSGTNKSLLRVSMLPNSLQSLDALL